MFNEFWLRLKALVARRRFDRDLEDEIGFHLAMREEKNRAAADSGDQARQAALRQFGNPTLAREELREMRSFTLLENLWQDLRYGSRLLRKSTAFTLVAVLTLALGIGANTAIFSLAYQILLRRLPVLHPEELVVLRSPGPKEGSTNSDGDNAASFPILCTRTCARKTTFLPDCWRDSPCRLVCRPWGGPSVPTANWSPATTLTFSA